MTRTITSGTRRREVLQVALGCFVQHGYEATTTRMLQKRAGISVGSFYHHFGSKAGVAAALFLEGLRDKNDAVGRALDAADTAETGIRAVVGAHVRWIADNPDWAGFLYQYRGTIPEGAASTELERVNKAFSRTLMGFFGPLIERGEIRRLPRECYSVIVLGPVQEFARRWLKGRTDTHIAELEHVFADAAWHAVRAE